MPAVLFTIGYAGRSIEDFIALLKQHQITALCDVRSVPYSRRHPQFSREPLNKALKARTIEYLFLGEGLGARPKDPLCYVDGKASYEKIAATASFQNGLERIRLGIQKGSVPALMCAEKDPLNCHRSILICRNLRGQGIEIRHIIDSSTTETQTDLEMRLIGQLKLYPDMFRDADQNSLIERAYDARSDRIAYVEKANR